MCMTYEHEYNTCFDTLFSNINGSQDPDQSLDKFLEAYDILVVDVEQFRYRFNEFMGKMHEEGIIGPATS